MDPDANLKEQRELAQNIRLVDYGRQGSVEYAEDTARLAELVLALDEWLRNEGFQPAAWCFPFLERTR